MMWNSISNPFKNYSDGIILWYNCTTRFFDEHFNLIHWEIHRKQTNLQQEVNAERKKTKIKKRGTMTIFTIKI